MTADDKSTPNVAAPTAIDASRRATLIKLAKWTPPIMMTLTLSQRASAESRPCPPEEPGTCPEP